MNSSPNLGPRDTTWPLARGCPGGLDLREAMVVETSYVTSGEVFVAYQISGQDGPDLLMMPGFVSHLDQAWENPNAARFFNDLGSFSRLIRFDKRGTGLSDRGVGVPHLDERIDDIRAVLDAAGSKTAYLFGVSEGGPMSILFAATYPGRVAGLILFGTYARTVGASVPFDDFAALERDIRANWGTGNSLPDFSPSATGAKTQFLRFIRESRAQRSGHVSSVQRLADQGEHTAKPLRLSPYFNPPA